MSALERRFAMIETALDALAPKPSPYDEFKAKYPTLEWLTTDELVTLDELMRAADVETLGDLGEADQARASAIYFAAEARRLSGAPKDCDLPEEPFEVRLQRAYEANNEAARYKREGEGR
jgi:hypothetical protein